MIDSQEAISSWLGRLELWVYDNIGSGDGTAHIRRIWKDDPRMADHLCDKWRGCVAKAKQGFGEAGESCEIQKAALWDFLTSLDERNHATFITHIAENGRPKH